MNHRQVYDCYVGGIALEPYLYTFQRHHIYSLISSPQSASHEVELKLPCKGQIEQVIGHDIPNDLLSLVISMATVPTIRCSPNGAASMIASSLSALIRDQLVFLLVLSYYQKSSINLFQQTKVNKGPCLRHPLLVILDRDVDLISPLQHSSHYQVSISYCVDRQPLVNDLLPCNANRVIIPNTTSFYLDKNQDDFWNDYACRQKWNAFT